MKHEIKIIATVDLPGHTFYKADKAESIKLHAGDSVHITYPDGTQKWFIGYPAKSPTICPECGVRKDDRCIFTRGEPNYCVLADVAHPVAITPADKLLEDL